MRGVVLDGYTLNPGDLSWDGLNSLGDFTVHDHTKAGDTVERAKGASIVLTNKTVLARETIAALPELKYIGVLATGYNVVDVAAAREQNIIVTNIPTYGTQSVAQMTFSLLLELTQHVGHHAQTVRDGRWCKERDFCYWDHPLVELQGLTLGIVGFGRIGQNVARIAEGFGMKVVACDSFLSESPLDGVDMVELDELFHTSDVVSLHCPLTTGNANLVNEERLHQMKKSALLINTSRGPLIDEAALAGALNEGQIAGAGLDVLATEPPKADNPLLAAKNCFITPHIAWATRAARGRLMSIAEENLRQFLGGTPVNVVN